MVWNMKRGVLPALLCPALAACGKASNVNNYEYDLVVYKFQPGSQYEASAAPQSISDDGTVMIQVHLNEGGQASLALYPDGSQEEIARYAPSSEGTPMTVQRKRSVGDYEVFPLIDPLKSPGGPWLLSADGELTDGTEICGSLPEADETFVAAYSDNGEWALARQVFETDGGIRYENIICHDGNAEPINPFDGRVWRFHISNSGQIFFENYKSSASSQVGIHPDLLVDNSKLSYASTEGNLLLCARIGDDCAAVVRLKGDYGNELPLPLTEDGRRFSWGAIDNVGRVFGAPGWTGPDDPLAGRASQSVIWSPATGPRPVSELADLGSYKDQIILPVEGRFAVSPRGDMLLLAAPSPASKEFDIIALKRRR